MNQMNSWPENVQKMRKISEAWKTLVLGNMSPQVIPDKVIP